MRLAKLTDLLGEVVLLGGSALFEGLDLVLQLGEGLLEFKMVLYGHARRPAPADEVRRRFEG